MQSINPKSIRTPRRVLAAFLLVTTVSAGSEIIHFRNGFSLEASSHTLNGRSISVQVGSGTLEFLAEEVTAIEPLAALVLAEGEAARTPVKAIDVSSILSDAALQQGVDAAFVRSVAIVESGLRQDRVSNKGAIGLMQLMPGTAKDLGVDATVNQENARGGVQYLRGLLLKYRGDSALALAAYNAGPGAVQRFGGVPPFAETRRYVVAVLKEYNHQLGLKRAAEKKIAASKSLNKPNATD